MASFRVLLSVAIVLLLCSCTQRTGYEIFRQMGYLECLKHSPHPEEDCRFAPDFDRYQQERRLHDAEPPGNP